MEVNTTTTAQVLLLLLPYLVLDVDEGLGVHVTEVLAVALQLP